jgi:hypothetical protein
MSETDGGDEPDILKVINAKLKKIQAAATEFHTEADRAAHMAVVAKTRRENRKWNNVNARARAVGTSVEASIWLLLAIRRNYERRGVPPERGLAVIDVMLTDADLLVDALAFEAAVLTSLAPQT